MLPVPLEAGPRALQMLNEVEAEGLRARGDPRNRLCSCPLVLMGKLRPREVSRGGGNHFPDSPPVLFLAAQAASPALS